MQLLNALSSFLSFKRPERAAVQLVRPARPASQMTMRMDECTLGFKAAQIAMREGVVPSYFVWGDDAVKYDRHIMVPLARDMYQNNAIYAAIIDRLVTEVIGEDGVELKPTHRLQSVNEEIKAKWATWCEYADFEQEDDFTEIERRVFTEVLNVGEVLLYKRRADHTLQIIESERIEDITYGERGEPESFRISTRGNEPIDISADDTIFICLKKNRKSDGRGTGLLWNCMDVVHMLMHILRSSAKSWGVTAKIALAVTTAGGSALVEALNRQSNGGATVDSDGDGEVDSAASIASRFIDIPDGTVFFGKPGESVSAVPHNGVPNAALDQHVLTYLRIISSVCGFDAATVLLGDYSKTSYSSSRAANVSLSKTVRRWQSFLRRRFYNRIYRWHAGTWLLSDKELGSHPEILTEFDWIMPRPQMIDNKGEAEANEKELTLGVTSHDDLVLSRNGDPEALEDARLREITRAYTKAVKSPVVLADVISAAELTRILCGLPIGKTQLAEQTKADSAATDGKGTQDVEATAEGQ